MDVFLYFLIKKLIKTLLLKNFLKKYKETKPRNKKSGIKKSICLISS